MSLEHIINTFVYIRSLCKMNENKKISILGLDMLLPLAVEFSAKYKVLVI